MPGNRPVDFTETVWKAAALVGKSAPRVADRILSDVFPETSGAAREEGADSFLRRGVIAEVKRIWAVTGIPAGVIYRILLEREDT